MKLVVLIACHNRRTFTLGAICSVISAAHLAGVEARFVVFDDGSTDGSADAIRTLVPDATILAGTGSTYWARSMAEAESAAFGMQDLLSTDTLLWLNDDVALDENALAVSLGVLAEHPESICVGALCDAESNELTYSGFRSTGIHPLRFSNVPAASTPQRIEAFNGNVVFVPVSIAKRMGGIEGRYAHALADIDYGFRACSEGIEILQIPGYVGTCSRNSQPVYRSFRHAWNDFTGIKGGGNLRSMVRILRAMRPRTWPIFVVVSYTLWAVRTTHSISRRRFLESRV